MHGLTPWKLETRYFGVAAPCHATEPPGPLVPALLSPGDVPGAGAASGIAPACEPPPWGYVLLVIAELGEGNFIKMSFSVEGIEGRNSRNNLLGSFI